MAAFVIHQRNPMQTRLHFAALLFTSIAFTQVAQADQLAAIKAKGELVCGTLGTDEPNSFIDAKSRQLVGYEAVSYTHLTLPTNREV